MVDPKHLSAIKEDERIPLSDNGPVRQEYVDMFSQRMKLPIFFLELTHVVTLDPEGGEV
ncbi:hypothetical protein [Stutzerimonas xanthomarina]|uniref:hypothetical protein n=1 Tax=Stutzerimonas xanthomarina TaxID=271420 RepID=UPI001F238C68|nr:hypothetical protein [Stutzerimonas xanthomarina]